MSVHAAAGGLFRSSALCLTLACSLSVHAQDVLHAEAVIAPLHPGAGVKPMLGAVVNWLPGTEVRYDQPNRTLHFHGPEAVQATPLAQLLFAHGFQLVQISGAGPAPLRTPAGVPQDGMAPADDAALRKAAFIQAHPEHYQRMLEHQGQRRGAP
ncbi:MAG TPA: hypothetical protein PKA92_16075 [Flavobacteriales bacterium]|nr:hypothetical protein [Flavobacteriales bacterium]